MRPETEHYRVGYFPFLLFFFSFFFFPVVGIPFTIAARGARNAEKMGGNDDRRRGLSAERDGIKCVAEQRGPKSSLNRDFADVLYVVPFFSTFSFSYSTFEAEEISDGAWISRGFPVTL